MRHSDNRGFWLPVDYPEPAASSEVAWWRIGSTQGLGRELEGITPLIEALPPGLIVSAWRRRMPSSFAQCQQQTNANFLSSWTEPESSLEIISSGSSPHQTPASTSPE